MHFFWQSGVWSKYFGGKLESVPVMKVLAEVCENPSAVDSFDRNACFLKRGYLGLVNPRSEGYPGG